MVSETFPNSYTSPHIHSWIFKTLWVIIVYRERDIVKQPMKKRLLCAQKCTRGGVGWGGVEKMQPQNKGPGM